MSGVIAVVVAYLAAGFAVGLVAGLIVRAWWAVGVPLLLTALFVLDIYRGDDSNEGVAVGFLLLIAAGVVGMAGAVVGAAIGQRRERA